MKNFAKLMFTFLAIGSILCLGIHIGKEKEKAKIPKFQEEEEENT